MMTWGVRNAAGLGAREDAVPKRQGPARSVHGGEEEAGDEGEVVDEEAELDLVWNRM
jgi:hypothetical protein